MLHPSGLHGDFLLNITLTGGDSFAPGDLTRMDRELREQIPIILEWLRKHIPEFRECSLVTTAPRIGLRNGRQIVGRECIRCCDLDEGTPVDDPIAVGLRFSAGTATLQLTQPWGEDDQWLRGIPYWYPAYPPNAKLCRGV